MPRTTRREDAHLLNGPQSQGEGLKQAEVDRVLTAREQKPPRRGPRAAGKDGRAAASPGPKLG